MQITVNVWDQEVYTFLGDQLRMYVITWFSKTWIGKWSMPDTFAWLLYVNHASIHFNPFFSFIYYTGSEKKAGHLFVFWSNGPFCSASWLCGRVRNRNTKRCSLWRWRENILRILRHLSLCGLQLHGHPDKVPKEFESGVKKKLWQFIKTDV